MAEFKFNVSNPGSFNVERVDVVETECASIFSFNIMATSGNDIRFSLTGSFENAFYTVLGVETPFTSETVVSFGSDLYVTFSIFNSGTSGSFNEVDVEINDDTTAEAYKQFTSTETRLNDTLPCGQVAGGISYDELTDTPENKTGHSLKLVRVNLDETKHEYVDPGLLGVDLNYIHVQAVASASWVIPHNQGKFLTPIVKDGAGNIVWGDVVWTDANNMTINFNTPFSGTAYLN